MSKVMVIGGGLGGLCCAALCAKKGHTVQLLERSAHLGGRARSQWLEGGCVNLGPHALYLKAAGMPILRELGIRPQGALPPNHAKALLDGKIIDLPSTPLSFLTSTALNFQGRLALSRWMAQLAFSIPEQTVADWLAPLPPDARRIVEALVRVSSYSHAPERMSAQAAAQQLKLALLGGVMYLHEGWEQLVLSLSGAAEMAGVQIQTHVTIEKVEEKCVILEDGRELMADHVVAALPPDAARRLGIPWPETQVIHAACLDLVLESMPMPERRFILGLDRPLYLSEHTGVARLGKNCVLHVAKYLAPDEEIQGIQDELEDFVDVALPQWRHLLKVKRWRGALPVAQALVEFGKPRPDIKVFPWLWRVGDGVGQRGMLVDATLASAADVAAQL